MKATKTLTGIAAFLAGAVSLFAQEKNLVMNGSFENTSGKIRSTGTYYLADSISSSNNTTVDLFSKEACGHDYDIPTNYMGTQESKSGNNYAGIIAFYADDAGVFKTKPGYRKYSEYIQLSCNAPLVAGKAYTVSYAISLAEKSAYAVSGFGIYFSKEKTDVKNNAFLKIVPQAVSFAILGNTEWTTLTGTYVASGGERYLTLGCFQNEMDTLKIIAANTNNSRKAYYYIDDVSVIEEINPLKDLSMVSAGACYQLNNLQFETDKAVILPGSFTEMKSLSDFLKSHQEVVVYISGYTDKTGTDEHNNKLSEQRAAAVKEYLVKDGIEQNRMKTKGYGEKHTIDKQNENSLVNRRVEITICAAPAR
ncbi:MAG: OmpA family protein [Bacteroidia bacterium]|nr:OmpA family protein [Bacteroidia bacterium]